MLVRKFIGQRLAEYYSQPANSVVGRTPFAQGINFKNLWGGSWQWRRNLKRLYNQQDGQWLTPVELFRPYYSNILANFIAETFRNSTEDSLEVFDLGGGQGTNADLILTHLHNTQPDIYKRITYTIVDCSETLMKAQESIVKAGIHADKVKLELKNLVDVADDRANFLPHSKTPTVVLALELFDNLPHDKVRRDPKTRLLEQAVVVQESGKQVSSTEVTELPPNVSGKEVFIPLSDSVLSKILLTLPSLAGATGLPVWVPTVACAVLHRLGKTRPNASLVMADFDWLPPPDLMSSTTSALPRLSTWAEGEPLITSMDRKDHECYLQAAHPCDILFPVDFVKMGSFIKRSWDDETAVVTIQKQAQFLQQYGPDEIRATTGWLTGFTPLLHDFGNCSVLTVTRSQGNSEQPQKS